MVILDHGYIIIAVKIQASKVEIKFFILHFFPVGLDKSKNHAVTNCSTGHTLCVTITKLWFENNTEL